MRIALVQLPPVTPLKIKYDDQMINSDGNKQEIGIVEFLTLTKKAENLTTASLLPSGAQLAHVRESSPL